MKKTKILTKVITTIMLATTLLLGNVGVTKAALQANPNTQYKKTDVPTNWMKNIRKMEEAGGTMGLDETLNDNLTAKESNNIDVHMMRSTEYGAIAILSASGYGNPDKITNSAEATTTGNKTGMVLNVNYSENVAGAIPGGQGIFPGTDTIYYDIYTANNNSARVGDALGTASVPNPGCLGWHNSSSAWSKSLVNSNTTYFKRGLKSIFSLESNGYIRWRQCQLSRGSSMWRRTLKIKLGETYGKNKK